MREKKRMAYQNSIIARNSTCFYIVKAYKLLPEDKRIEAYNDTLNAIRSADMRANQSLENELNNIRKEEIIHKGIDLLSEIAQKRIK